MNFAHVDPAIPATGRAELARLLADVEADGPVFLTDTEVAQLAVRGVSARPVMGRGVVLRNGTRSRRIVAVGPPAFDREFIILNSVHSGYFPRTLPGGPSRRRGGAPGAQPFGLANRPAPLTAPGP